MSPARSRSALACTLVHGAEAIECEISRPDPHRLLAVVYGLDASRSSPPGAPTLNVPNRVLSGEPVAELWRSDRPARTGRRGQLEWAEDGRLLAGRLMRPAGEAIDLAAAARDQFAELLELLEEQGVPHLVRIWNYLPGINRGDGDLERYRRFNLGRARAFEERFGAESAAWRAPASSAVGTSGGELRTAFLASRAPVIQIENPRQLPARSYPHQYGPRAPSFSRASLVIGGGDHSALFLSGTASIVGHASAHVGSFEAQLGETLRNIEIVLDEARRAAQRELPALAGFDLVKIYLRNGGQLDAALARIAAALGPEVPAVVLAADICRAELLLEIDGVALR